MTKDKALKLALEALESKETWGSSIREAKERAITAIKEALAQPEQSSSQEPVAWASMLHDERIGIITFTKTIAETWEHNGETIKELYFTSPPPQREPLMDEQIKQIRFDTITELVTMEESELRFARAIEAAHGIKE